MNKGRTAKNHKEMKEKSRFVKIWKKWGPPILFFTAALQFLDKQWSIGAIFVIMAISIIADDE
jgi:hypothetical protein